MSSNEIIMRRARLGRALGKGFRGAYDHLGYVVLVTLISFFLTALAYSGAGLAAGSIAGLPKFARLAMMIPTAFVGYLCAVGVFCYAGRSVAHEHPTVADTWSGVRTLFVPAVRLFIVDVIITVVLVADAVFFISMGARSPVFLVMGLICGYAIIIWLMMAMYHLPLLIAQTRMESGPGTLTILRKSFLMTADNPAFTVGLFVVIIAFAALCALPALIGMAVLFLGAAAFLLTHALNELLVKYGVVETEPEAVEDRPWSLPESWRKRTAGVDTQDGSGETNG